MGNGITGGHPLQILSTCIALGHILIFNYELYNVTIRLNNSAIV